MSTSKVDTDKGAHTGPSSIKMTLGCLLEVPLAKQRMVSRGTVTLYGNNEIRLAVSILALPAPVAAFEMRVCVRPVARLSAV